MDKDSSKFEFDGQSFGAPDMEAFERWPNTS